jgi:DNA polymerase III alpha subunit
VLAPEINTSGASYTIDEARGAIRRGLQSIHGVGSISAEKLHGLQPFTDLSDLVARCSHRVSGWKEFDGSPESLTGVLERLYDSGCLTTLIHGRKSDAPM